MCLNETYYKKLSIARLLPGTIRRVAISTWGMMGRNVLRTGKLDNTRAGWWNADSLYHCTRRSLVIWQTQESHSVILISVSRNIFHTQCGRLRTDAWIYWKILSRSSCDSKESMHVLLQFCVQSMNKRTKISTYLCQNFLPGASNQYPFGLYAILSLSKFRGLRL